MFLTDIVNNLNFSGYCLAIIEILIFYTCARYIKSRNINLSNVNSLIYYWLMFTCLTAIWEAYFINNYRYVYSIADELKINKKHI